MLTISRWVSLFYPIKYQSLPFRGRWYQSLHFRGRWYQSLHFRGRWQIQCRCWVWSVLFQHRDDHVIPFDLVIWRTVLINVHISKHAFMEGGWWVVFLSICPRIAWRFFVMRVDALLFGAWCLLMLGLHRGWCPLSLQQALSFSL